MPLPKSALQQRIKTIFSRQDSSTIKISRDIARAYMEYAQQALGPAGDPVVISPAAEIGLAQALASIMSGRMPGPLSALTIGNAITRFWLAPPVITATGGVASSIVVTPGVSTLTTTNVDSHDRAASSLSNSLHIMTKTVIVTYPPPLTPGVLL
jgi:hypothetical protein